jgi:transposase InsO family protein
MAEPRRRPAPQEIAFWRYQQIEEALAPGLQREARGQILRRLSRTPVRWPSGVSQRVSLATLYRWIELHGQGGLEALQPRPRHDRHQRRRELPKEVIEEAVRLLGADPGMSFTFLLGVLEARFGKHSIARSTLQRRLAAHPDYRRLQRAKTRTRRRTRFVAHAPHDLWQTDAKGPFPVRLVGGREILVHVLSILDDASRAVLAALIGLTVDLGAAVRVFRHAALRWGLPERLYADRASIFDAQAFRQGLAELGVHRVWTRGRNAPVRGKIEAYHRVLGLWFTERLRAQQVVDLVHLQQLLDGVLSQLYHRHRHRGLQQSPQDALGGQVSARAVAPTRLYEAFRQEKRLKTHPTTGEVEIKQTTYLVPEDLRGQRLRFFLDPAAEIPPLGVHPESGEPFALRRAAIRAEPPDQTAAAAEPQRWGAGPLQALYDAWRGQRRPLAEPGFGLPELYLLLAQLAGRQVPQTDAEAALVQRLYRQIGPFTRAATETACHAIARELGPGRPLQTYLEALARRVEPSSVNHLDPQGERS